MDSAHTGEVRIDIDGPRVLRYDWAALSRLRTALGKDYEQAVAQAMTDLDTGVIARALAAGLCPPLSPEAVERASPPLVESVRALERALKYAYYGGEEPGPVPADPPPGPSGWWTRWRKRIGSLSGRAWRRTSSGA